MTRPEILASLLTEEFSLAPHIGLELEWHIRPKEWSSPFEPAAQERDGYLDALCLAADAEKLQIDSFDEEHGPGQFEAALKHGSDIKTLARQALALKDMIRDVGFRRGYVTDFHQNPTRHLMAMVCMCMCILKTGKEEMSSVKRGRF